MKKYISPKYILPVLLFLVVSSANAQSITKDGSPYTFSTMMADIGPALLYIVLGVCILMLFVVINLFYSVSKLRNKIMAETHPEYAARAEQSFWGSIFQVRHTSTDKEVILDHNYDDIHELNNPIPRWFMALFYITVFFGVGYILNYHVFKSAKLQDDEYIAELKKAEADYQVYLKTVGDKINAETVSLLTDKENLHEGKEFYNRPGSCASCHGKQGEGNIGPNLTDVYWLHGGGVKDVFKTISEGVPNTAMKAWKKDFSAFELQQITSYVLSLQGSKPAGGKEPQGEKWSETGPAPATAPADSIKGDTLKQTTMK